MRMMRPMTNRFVPSSNNEEVSFQSLGGFRGLAERGRFKAWFLDQLGVLHDGKNPYPGAISTLEKLAKTGAKIVIIRSSSKRASVTLEKMRNLGFDPPFLWRPSPAENSRISICRGLQVVEDVTKADFILAHGTEALGWPNAAALPMKFEDLEKILDLSAAK